MGWVWGGGGGWVGLGDGVGALGVGTDEKRTCSVACLSRSWNDWRMSSVGFGIGRGGWGLA
jgi:hypothetical protein